MRILVCALISMVGAFAHADKIKCSNPAGLDALIYDPEKMTMSFVSQSVTGFPIPREVAISRDTENRPGLTEEYTVFIYPLANGQSVEITWVSGESEILRGLLDTPTGALVKTPYNRTVENFINCEWIDRN